MVAEGKKRGLGRGLSALIMDSERREASPEGEPSAGRSWQIQSARTGFFSRWWSRQIQRGGRVSG